jgi:anthranilate phosphoribosyltransferase
MRDLLIKLVRLEHLSPEESEQAMVSILSGESTPAQIGSFLTALKIKGEHTDEIYGFARAMRRFVEKVETVRPGVVDTCGTGGDGRNTFNISTAAALVTAAAGVPVAKHGNRSASSKCGSADVLEALGVVVDLTPAQAADCLEQTGICFLFAQSYHKAMKYAAGPRKELGFGTVFNILGPLTNPAGAKRQLLGSFQKKFVEPMAQVLRRLGTEHALVVHGNDGLDEITVSSTTFVAEVTPEGVRTFEISPEDAGLSFYPLEAVRGGDPQENAEMIRAVLCGERGARRDIVALNAGASIYVGGKASSIREGVQIALETIDSGKALETLQRFIAATRSYGSSQTEGASA